MKITIPSTPEPPPKVDTIKNYFVARDGNKLGPYSLDEMRELYVQGTLLKNDVAWTDGMSDWSPLTDVLGISSQPGNNPPLLNQLASSNQRFGTFLIDFFFLFVSAILFVAIGSVVLGNSLENINGYLLWFIVSCFYYIPQEALSGRTLGKLIVGTKAVNEDGSELTAGAAFVRTLCRFIPFEAFSFFGGRPRGWHDTISKSKVISVRR